MIPVVALVGRPNVGKSTLFNRLTRSREALVANIPGLTRDRKYGEAKYQDHRFLLIDTGGLSGEEEGIDVEMARQSELAIVEADFIFFLVDARAGLTPTDQQIVTMLRRHNKPVIVVANKIDGLNQDVVLTDFYALGFAELLPVSASHGRGVNSLLDRLIEFSTEQFPQVEDEQSEERGRGIKIGVIGRPNVGKSTLVNRLLGEDRVVVYDQPGTTRDSIYIDYERDDKPYTLIDTAGVRRRKNVRAVEEKFSIVKTLQAINDANVTVLVIDGREGLVDQDLHLLGYAIDAGRAVVIAVNKWDGLSVDTKEAVKREIKRRLHFIDYVEIHYISALHGSGVGNLYQSIEKAYQSATRSLQTHRLTTILEDAVADHPPPLVHNRRIKLRYAHAGGSNPPIIVIHGNQTEKVPAHYKRYLEKIFRRELKLSGTPIRVEFKGGENPFEGRKNKLAKGRLGPKKPGKKPVRKKT
jgi:GTP-binding protein